MKRRLAALVTTVLLGIAGSTFISSPAVAIACTANPTSLCFYDNSSGSGSSLMYVHDGEDRPGCFNLPAAYRNRTSYIYNRTPYAWKVYLTTNCASFQVGTIWAGSKGPMTAPWNNSIESFRGI